LNSATTSKAAKFQLRPEGREDYIAVLSFGRAWGVYGKRKLKEGRMGSRKSD